jgi:AAA domain
MMGRRIITSDDAHKFFGDCRAAIIMSADREGAWFDCAEMTGRKVRAKEIGRAYAADQLREVIREQSLFADNSEDEIQATIAAMFERAADEPGLAVNGHGVIAQESALATSPDECSEAFQSRAIDFSKIPLTIDQWLERDLPAPDRLLGEWLTTTSRALLNAPTGIGKTNLGLALGAHSAAGVDFLHWRAYRPARVLFIDGEMSNRLLKRRAEDVVRRLTLKPAYFYLLSHQDVPEFQPLNTPSGHAFLIQLIKWFDGVDLIVFDNIMSLIAGDQKDEEGWQRAWPLINSLTRQGIGQLWISHTGHDTTRGYGTKTREWRMDTVLHLTEVRRPDTDVSFQLELKRRASTRPRRVAILRM